MFWQQHPDDRGRSSSPLLICWCLEALIKGVPQKENGTDTGKTSRRTRKILPGRLKKGVSLKKTAKQRGNCSSRSRHLKSSSRKSAAAAIKTAAAAGFTATRAIAARIATTVATEFVAIGLVYGGVGNVSTSIVLAEDSRKCREDEEKVTKKENKSGRSRVEKAVLISRGERCGRSG